MLKHLLRLSACVIYLLLSYRSAHAVSEFSTSYHSQYNFSQSSSAEVTHTIELTNNLSHIYPTVYNLALSSGNLRDIQVMVGDTNVSPEVESVSNLTTIHIPINNAQIGKDQKTVLKVTYKSDSFVEAIGDTYALTLPKTVKGNEAVSFVREVIVPIDYPDLSYSSIAPQNQENIDNTVRYRFVGNGDSSLTLHFGTESHITLDLEYLLKNTTASSAVSEIAIPPDTGYQKITLEQIDPEPKEIIVDSDGNWLARYDLAPASKKMVKVKLALAISPVSIYFDPSTSSPTGAAEYWEHSSQIKRLATQLKNPRNLYVYLIENLTYDYSQITAQKRLGADQALTSPNTAICTEFTDLFVATSRAMGIPSRAIIGYAITNNEALKPQADNQDILHAYPEYLDSETKKWIAVDPTWGHTTGGSEYFDRLDFGHITFVRWGIDSSYPLPAGSYRDESSPKQISFAINSPTTASSSSAYQIVKDGEQPVLINTGKQAIIQTKLSIDGNEVFVPYLPPFGRLPITPQGQGGFNPTYYYLIASIVALLLVALLLKLKRMHKKQRE